MFAILILIAIIIGAAVIYGLGGLIFMLLWNWLMPFLWPAAPHITWMAGIAASWVIGILQSIFGRTTVKS